MKQRFVTVVACIDGRVHESLTQWARGLTRADWADLVTRPGCDGVLADGPAERVAGVRDDVGVSLSAHAPVAVVVSGHHDCAANPGDRAAHLPQIRRAVRVVREWDPGIPVLGAWVGEDWSVESVEDPC